MKQALSGRRRLLSKSDLLPLRADHVRKLQLKHHLALVALRCGPGDVDQVVTLTTAVQISYLLAGGPSQVSVPDVGVYQMGEIALERCAVQLEAGEPTMLGEYDHQAIAEVLTAYDIQLARTPTHRYFDAQIQLRDLFTVGRSAIPLGSVLVEPESATNENVLGF